MRISVRFNQDEERRFNEMKRATGLSNTTLIKKCLFDNDRQYYNKNIFTEVGKFSTNINLTKQAIKDNNIPLAQKQICIMEKGITELWQNL